jgi:hypothetical protein
MTAGLLSEETELPMARVAGDARSGQYRATLPAQPESRLVRCRIEAIDSAGAKRSSPAPNDLRRAWSYSTFVNNNSATVPIGLLWETSGKAASLYRRTFGETKDEPARGRDTFIYLPPAGGQVQTFDFVHAPRRNGGFKVHFLKDQTLRGMTSINLIFEASPRFVLAEPLAYEVYRLAGVPAETTEHIRLSVNGTGLGYHLLVEQPNKSFLARHHRNTSGNLYKLIWYGRGVIGKHEKKTNLTGGHDDLLAVLDRLNKTRGAEQWAFIQKHFNVEEFASYFAVNMCIQNWDGFHNNYFIYHDIGGTGRWEIYPWDEDKTWGDYDGASPNCDRYEMPLTYSMNGAVRPGALGGSAGTRGPYAGWWREPGFLSGPMLANPQFRQRFLVRLREVCETIFTEEKVLPLIDAMEKRLEAEVSLRAQINRTDAAPAVAQFRAHMQSFRNQVTHRRRFILAELDKALK